jgi:hypothetical protein
VTTPQFLASALGIQYATANNLIARLVDAGVLAEMTGYRRNRRFSYQKYLDMFEEERAPGPAREGGAPGAAGEETTLNEPTVSQSGSDRQMEAAERVMREEGDALRKLAE